MERKISREDLGLKVARENGREDFAKFSPVTKKSQACKTLKRIDTF